MTGAFCLTNVINNQSSRNFASMEIPIFKGMCSEKEWIVFSKEESSLPSEISSDRDFKFYQGPADALSTFSKVGGGRIYTLLRRRISATIALLYCNLGVIWKLYLYRFGVVIRHWV